MYTLSPLSPQHERQHILRVSMTCILVQPRISFLSLSLGVLVLRPVEWKYPSCLFLIPSTSIRGCYHLIASHMPEKSHFKNTYNRCLSNWSHIGIIGACNRRVFTSGHVCCSLDLMADLSSPGLLSLARNRWYQARWVPHCTKQNNKPHHKGLWTSLERFWTAGEWSMVAFCHGMFIRVHVL